MLPIVSLREPIQNISYWYSCVRDHKATRQCNVPNRPSSKGTGYVQAFFRNVSGPKLANGDNVGLMNFPEELLATTRILQGDVERQASVSMNLKCLKQASTRNDPVFRMQTLKQDIKDTRAPKPTTASAYKRSEFTNQESHN